MKTSVFVAIATLLSLLTACGSESEESNLNQQPQQGVLSSQQQRALEAAGSVEQTLLDSAAQRQKELEARLQAQ